MSNPVNSVTQAQPADQNTAARRIPAESKAPHTPTDTVQLSSAAKAILQEVQENHAQTVQEAASGDSQAKRLLAKEAAAAYVPKQ